MPYNGALSPAQLAWLEETLTGAAEEEETVMVVCHVPLHPLAADNLCLLWNYQVTGKILSDPCTPNPYFLEEFFSWNKVIFLIVFSFASNMNLEIQMLAGREANTYFEGFLNLLSLVIGSILQ